MAAMAVGHNECNCLKGDLAAIARALAMGELLVL